jgi:DNA-binding transcriptional LysR family regulator
MKGRAELPSPALLDAAVALRLAVRLGSYARAAEYLGVARSSISRQIEQLENHFGVQLLQRTTRKLALTEAGEKVFEQTQHLMDAWSTLNTEWAELHGALGNHQQQAQGMLRVSCSVTFCEAHLLKILPAFLDKYPQLVVDLTMSDAYVDLIDARQDVAIFLGNPPSSPFRSRPLGTLVMALAAAPAYLEQAGVPSQPDDLRQHRCIVYRDTSLHARWCLRRGKRAQVVPVQGPLQLNTARATLEMTLAGQGISLGLELMLRPYFDSGQLRPVLPDYQVALDDVGELSLYALYPSQRRLPAKVRLFIDFLAESLLAARNKSG